MLTISPDHGCELWGNMAYADTIPSTVILILTWLVTWYHMVMVCSISNYLYCRHPWLWYVMVDGRYKTLHTLWWQTGWGTNFNIRININIGNIRAARWRKFKVRTDHLLEKIFMGGAKRESINQRRQGMWQFWPNMFQPRTKCWSDTRCSGIKYLRVRANNHVVPGPL